MVTGMSGVAGVNAAAAMEEHIKKEHQVEILLFRQAAENPAAAQKAKCMRVGSMIIFDLFTEIDSNRE